MAEPSNAELKQLLNDVLSKVSTVEGEVSSLKVDQARLHVAVNNVQSQRFERCESSADGAKGKGTASSSVASITSASPHKIRFPTFDGSTDPITWIHRCEQFFRQARSSDDDKV
ncbi:unnamed protein product [Urochloa humidicola]